MGLFVRTGQRDLWPLIIIIVHYTGHPVNVMGQGVERVEEMRHARVCHDEPAVRPDTTVDNRVPQEHIKDYYVANIVACIFCCWCIGPYIFKVYQPS